MLRKYWLIIAALGFAVTAMLILPLKSPDKPVELSMAQKIKQVKEIYNNLKSSTGQSTGPLVVLQSDDLNAWTDGTTVTVTTRLLDFLKGDKDKLALVLGHEMAHYMLRHPQNIDPVSTIITMENQADRMGVYIMAHAGYDACKGRWFAMDMAQEFGVNIHQVQGDHPAWGFRFDAYTMPQCGDIK